MAARVHARIDLRNMDYSQVLPCLHGSKCARVCQKLCSPNRFPASLLSACPSCITWPIQCAPRILSLPVRGQPMMKLGGGISSHSPSPHSRTTPPRWQRRPAAICGSPCPCSADSNCCMRFQTPGYVQILRAPNAVGQEDAYFSQHIWA